MKRCSLIIREMQIKTARKYFLTSVRIAIIKKSTNYTCWRGCGEKQTLPHCWWECKLVQPLWRAVWRILKKLKIELPLLLFSRLVVSDSLQPHGLQHARLPCPSLPLGVCSNSLPLSWWCHPTISSSVAPSSSCYKWEKFSVGNMGTLYTIFIIFCISKSIPK